MRHLKTTAITLALFLGVSGSWAADRGPSTPEERAKAIKLTRQLERDPLGGETKKSREWLTSWLVVVPGVSVTVCAPLLGPVAGGKTNRASELVAQSMYSSAAFILEHPKKAQDDLATFLAGVEGALRAYEAILKSRPQERWPFLDDLLARRKAGTLGEYVRGAMVKCK